MDCIKAYLSITGEWREEEGGNGTLSVHLCEGEELVTVQFSKLLEKLKCSELSSVWPLLLDVAAAFVPFLAQAALASLFNLLTPLLDVRRERGGGGQASIFIYRKADNASKNKNKAQLETIHPTTNATAFISILFISH